MIQPSRAVPGAGLNIYIKSLCKFTSGQNLPPSSCGCSDSYSCCTAIPLLHDHRQLVLRSVESICISHFLRGIPELKATAALHCPVWRSSL